MTPSPKALASPHIGLSRRGHSSRSNPAVASHGEAALPSHTSLDSLRQDRGRQDRGRQDRGRQDRGRQDRGRQDRGRQDRGRQDREAGLATSPPPPPSLLSSSSPPPRLRPSTTENTAAVTTASPPLETTFSPDSASIEAMRRKMSAVIAQKAQVKATVTATTTGAVPTATSDASDLSDLTAATASASSDATVLESPFLPSALKYAHSTSLSADSARTVGPPPAASRISPPLPTPSYPFPRMCGSPGPTSSLHSSSRHKASTVTFPTGQPTHAPTRPDPVAHTLPSETSILSDPKSLLSPGVPDDAQYPTPDLYQVILMLNAEPGLDMWWTNLTEILSDEFGAERASLALPGDVADVQKVPWGQKATFNILGCDPNLRSAVDSASVPDAEHKASAPASDALQRPFMHHAATTTTAVENKQRPPLQARHSLSGPPPQDPSLVANPKPPSLVRAVSSMNPQQVGHGQSSSPALSRVQSAAFELPSVSKPADVAPTLVTPRSHVYKTLQPLRTEPDALLVRTGVASLFGKRKSVVLTRAYSSANSSASPRIETRLHSVRSRTCLIPDDAATQSAGLGNTESQHVYRTKPSSFDESEQPEPEPWSQSPLPSPFARHESSESPFFAQPQASVDEAAFEQYPPIYDYTASANQSLHPIGLDMSKSLVHVPLVLPAPARGTASSTSSLPIAILSFLSPVNPYPRNLRHSLTHLLPHLASSFSMAQQYTNLLNRITKDAAHLPASATAMGGTFSDQGSELELVAELRDEITNERRTHPLASPNTIPTPECIDTVYQSAGQSSTATPMHDYVGFSPFPQTPGGKSGSEIAEGYFTAKRHKGSSHKPGTPGRTTKTSSRRSGTMSSRAPTDVTNQPHSPRHASSPASESGFSDASLLERDKFEIRRAFQQRESSFKEEDIEKPLPELIASLLLNAVPLQLFLAKPTSGDLVWTNSKFDAFRSQGEGVVRDPWKNVHPEDRAGVVKLWEEAVKSGSQFTHYIRVKRFNSDSDAEFRWFVFRASTLMSSNGRLLYWIGSFLDVHEQYIKSLEANEREATISRDAKIKALAESIPQIMFEALEGDGLVSVNQQWQAYSGQAPEDSQGLGFTEHVHPEDLFKCGIIPPLGSNHSAPDSSSSSNNSSYTPTTIATTIPLFHKTWLPVGLNSLENLVKSGSVTVERDENGRLSYLTEVRLRSRRGEYRWFLVRVSRVESATPTGSGRASWYGTCTDIETRKVLEHQLNLANKKVHSEMESKTKFFANMSHEIRTPLNGIIGSMPWLLDSDLNHEQRRTVDIILNSANNLRELVDNILDVTKVEAGKMALVPKWFHVRTLCEEVIDTVSSRAIERGLELNYTLEANVPTTVKADPFRVRQVLLNLLSNAVKFTEQGEVYMKCSARGLSDSKDVNTPSAVLCFEVVDTGRGFNESDFNRLFKQFGQLNPGTNHDAGSGLGLFLSKQLVEMHGGKLSVQSQAGEGSTFSFFIRVDLAPPGAERSSPPPLSSAAKTGDDPLRHSPSSVSSTTAITSISHRGSKTPPAAIPLGNSQSVPKAAASTSSGSSDTWSPSVDTSSGLDSPGISSTVPLLSLESMTASTGGGGGGGTPASSNVLMESGLSCALVGTPEAMAGLDARLAPTERQFLLENTVTSQPTLPCNDSESAPSTLPPPEVAHPATYSIVVICPAEHARTAIKQHIEHVVPLQIPVNVTTLPSIGSFLHLINGPVTPTFTHIVLDLPTSSDIMLFMHQITHLSAPVMAALVVVTDHYQKRDIQDDFQALTATGRKAFLVHKPVKPSVFAMIFDPAHQSNLSKDQAREVAQTKTDQFRTITTMVREKVGNRKFRVLLVEDSPVNRMIIVRYLNKVAIENDTADDGQQCCDMVKGKPYGHYSLIICDIQMPRKNGYQTCNEIRDWERENHYPPLPIMALTANAMPEERSAAATAGFTDYLTKPVDFNVLGRMMMTLLDQNAPHIFLKERPVGQT